MTTDGGGAALRIGFLGRVPPPLGGAGLERQMELTKAALERRGHSVVHTEAAEAGAVIDVLHAFGSEPAVWHHLRHWTRNRVPLVLSPVVVVSPGARELAVRLSARVPFPVTSSGMRRELLTEASAIVAGTDYERELVERLGAAPDRITVIGNGADPVPAGQLPQGLPDEYVLMVGAVSPRKRQAEVLEALGGDPPVVVAGSYAGPPSGRGAWEATVRGSGARWLGEVDDPGAVAALQDRALAVIHLSDAEVQSLAVLEALRQGTPVVLSDIPSHRELQARYPQFVHVVGAPGELPGVLAALRARRPEGAPAIPTWDDRAAELESVYRRVLSG